VKKNSKSTTTSTKKSRKLTHNRKGNIALIKAFWEGASTRKEATTLTDWKRTQSALKCQNQTDAINASQRNLLKKEEKKHTSDSDIKAIPKPILNEAQTQQLKTKCSQIDTVFFEQSLAFINQLTVGFKTIINKQRLSTDPTKSTKHNHQPTRISNTAPNTPHQSSHSTAEATSTTESDDDLTQLFQELKNPKKYFNPKQALISEDEIPIDVAWMQLILLKVYFALKNDPCLNSSGLHDRKRHPERVRFLNATLKRLQNIIRACRGTFSIDKFILDSTKMQNGAAASATGAFANMITTLYIQIESLFFSLIFYTSHSQSFTQGHTNQEQRLEIFNFALRSLKKVRGYSYLMSEYLVQKHIEVSVQEYCESIQRAKKDAPTAEQIYSKVSSQVFRGIFNPLNNEFFNFDTNTLTYSKNKTNNLQINNIKALSATVNNIAQEVQQGQTNPFTIRALSSQLIQLNTDVFPGKNPFCVPALINLVLERSFYNQRTTHEPTLSTSGQTLTSRNLGDTSCGEADPQPSITTTESSSP